MISSKATDARYCNIDSVIDMMIETQKQNGVSTNMREYLFDPVTSKRINEFKRRKLEEKGVDLSNYNRAGCKGCNKCKKDNNQSNIERGVFVFNEDDLIDESDDGYVCDYCLKIGVDGRYAPEECDVCDDCYECQEYIRGVCDGCEYSVCFNGQTYGEIIGERSESTASMSPEDQRIFDELEECDVETDILYPIGGFTIMNY